MISEHIHDFEFFFLLGAWCLDDEKMWETKGKLAFSFSLICLVSKKLEATESRPNRTDLKSS